MGHFRRLRRGKFYWALAFIGGTGLFLARASVQSPVEAPKIEIEFVNVPDTLEEQLPIPGGVRVSLKNFEGRTGLLVMAYLRRPAGIELVELGRVLLRDVENGVYTFSLHKDLKAWAKVNAPDNWRLYIDAGAGEKKKVAASINKLIVIEPSPRPLVFIFQGMGFQSALKVSENLWRLRWSDRKATLWYRYTLENRQPLGTRAAVVEKAEWRIEQWVLGPRILRDFSAAVDGGKPRTEENTVPIEFPKPGRYVFNIKIIVESRLVCDEAIQIDVITAKPEIKGEMELKTERFKVGEKVAGEAKITIANLPDEANLLFPDDRDVILRGTLTPVDSSTPVSVIESRLAGKSNGTFTVDLEKDLPFALEKLGYYNFLLEARFAGDPDPLWKWTKIGLAPLTVEKSVKRLTLMPPMVLKPAAPTDKTPVTFQLKYKIEGIPPGMNAVVLEEVILKEPQGPPEGRKFSRRWDFQYAGDVLDIDSDLDWPPLPKGKYKIEYTVDWPQAEKQTGTFEFEVLGGVNYCLVGVQDDPWKGTGNTIGGGKKFLSLTRSGASIERIQNNEVVETNTVSISGRPPDILYPGQTFDMTVSVSATAKAGWGWEIASGMGGKGIEVQPTDPKKPKAEANSHNKKTSDSATFRCSIPDQSITGPPGKDLSLWVYIGGGYNPVEYFYQECAPGGAGPPDKIPPEKVTPPKPPPQIKARLVYPTIELVPGEVSKVCGLYIKDWKINTEDRVYIKVPTQDAWGSLTINRNIVVFSGDWSLAPEHMDGEEHYVSMFWSARSTAQPGSFAVPIRVSQTGAGKPVDLILNIRVLPKKTGQAGPPVADPSAGTVESVTSDVSVLGLSARLDCSTLTLVRGEVSTPCTIYIQGWKDTNDPVEVVFPWADPSGSLPGGIVVFPGTSKLNPFLMFTPGVTESQDYACVQYFRAKEDAPSGTSSIPVQVRQKGKGSVLLFLNVAVPPKLIK